MVALGNCNSFFTWIDPKYDARGNMTTAPRPGEEADASNALITVYDAWNRPAKVHKTPPGDANLDGKVDESDLIILTANMDEPGGWQQGDFDGDETVTEADESILLANWHYDVATGTDTVIAEYQYDGLNRRLVKLIPNDSNWDRTDYYYNAAWQLLEERFDDNIAPDYKGNPVTDVKYQYVWGVRYVHSAVLRDENTDIGTDNDCTDPGGSERLYYCNDANFNVTALINTDGTVAERYVYDPYGKVTIYEPNWSAPVDWADSKKNIILYTGHKYDNETGLYQGGQRYYHPTLGRWTTRDPIGNVDGMNLYEYVGSNPLARLDAMGLRWLKKSRRKEFLKRLIAHIKHKWDDQYFAKYYTNKNNLKERALFYCAKQLEGKDIQGFAVELLTIGWKAIKMVSPPGIVATILEEARKKAKEEVEEYVKRAISEILERDYHVLGSKAVQPAESKCYCEIEVMYNHTNDKFFAVLRGTVGSGEGSVHKDTGATNCCNPEDFEFYLIGKTTWKKVGWWIFSVWEYTIETTW